MRLHPYESHGITNSSLDGKFKQLKNSTHEKLVKEGLTKGANFCVLEGKAYATESFLKNCDLGITINSQAGLEMLMLGKPVVVAGRASYAGKGFTYDVPDKALYENVLENALKRFESLLRYRQGYVDVIDQAESEA